MFFLVAFMIFSRSASLFVDPASFYAAMMLLLLHLEWVGPAWSPKLVGFITSPCCWVVVAKTTVETPLLQVPWAAVGTSPSPVGHGRVRPFLRAVGSSSPGSTFWLTDLQVGLFLGKEIACRCAAVSEKMTMPKWWKFGRYKFNVFFWPPVGSPGKSYKGWRDRAILGELKESV